MQKKGLASKDIHAGMVATLVDDAPALSNVNKRGKLSQNTPVLPQVVTIHEIS